MLFLSVRMKIAVLEKQLVTDTKKISEIGIEFMLCVWWCKLHEKLWIMDKTKSAYKWMLNRCYNPKLSCFERYGARGITVCPEWLGPAGYGFFLLQMGMRPEGYGLDRVDNSKGYSKENCRWATRKTQSINQGKRSDNKSGYFGVHWCKTRKKWRATIKNDRKTKEIGYFETPESAAVAYDKIAKQLHGDFAKQNFGS